jgi:hypothetical protein
VQLKYLFRNKSQTNGRQGCLYGIGKILSVK